MKRLSQFYSHNRWTYKTHYFHFSIFFSKTNQQNEFKYFCIIMIVLEKIDRSFELSPLKKNTFLLKRFGFFMLFRRLAIRFKNQIWSLKKIQKKIFRQSKESVNYKKLFSPLKIDRVDPEIKRHTQTHARRSIQTFF